MGAQSGTNINKKLLKKGSEKEAEKKGTSEIKSSAGVRFSVQGGNLFRRVNPRRKAPLGFWEGG